MDTIRANKHLGTVVVSGVIAIRVVAAPLFLYTFISNLTMWTLGIFLFAVATDALDGYVARRLGGASPFLGAYSDPAADFVLVLAAFLAFVMKGIYPFWTILLIIAMFTQFILTSRLERPIYDPVGKYYGVFLFCAIAVTVALPDSAVRHAVLVGILAFTVASLIGRFLFFLGLWKERALSHDRPGP
jgi:phosphatidylglycerophosphate synthase